jgi:pimeloyl-ACP methyl ester carboxylesterase
MRGMAGMVVQLLDELSIASTDVLGYSWGGVLAQQLAHSHPDRVKRLILVATVPGLGGIPPRLRVTTAALNSGRLTSRAASQALASLIYGGDYRAVRGRPARQLPNWWQARPPSMRGYLQQLYAISSWSSLPWLRRLRPPTLIISGTDDPLAPSMNARLMSGLIPDAQLHLVPGGGHLWLLDHAIDSAAVIEEFLTTTPAPGSG